MNVEGGKGGWLHYEGMKETMFCKAHLTPVLRCSAHHHLQESALSVALCFHSSPSSLTSIHVPHTYSHKRHIRPEYIQTSRLVTGDLQEYAVQDEGC